MARRRALSPTAIYAIVTLAALGVAWQLSAGVLPAPAEVGAALARLWTTQGLFDELATSFALNLRALAVSAVITLAFAYASVAPAARPLVEAVSKLRFTGVVGWGFVLAVWARDGHALKLWLLVFAMTPFFVTQLAAVIADLPRDRFDHARALGLSRARVVWEVVVLGTVDPALEALRQSAAMGWMMLTTVEGLVRGEGGVGAMLLNENKHLQLDAVFALIAVVLVVGAAQDAALAWLRRALCPYAALATARP